jgi:hypothetical protein
VAEVEGAARERDKVRRDKWRKKWKYIKTTRIYGT